MLVVMSCHVVPCHVGSKLCFGNLVAASISDVGRSGAWVGVGYTMIGLIAWVGSYFFRVATKNMTYAVQVWMRAWQIWHGMVD